MKNNCKSCHSCIDEDRFEKKILSSWIHFLITN